MRGVSVTHTFGLPFETSLVSKARVTYAYNGVIVLVKNTEDLVIAGNTIMTRLSRADTLTFPNSDLVSIQLEIETVAGVSLKTPVYKRYSTELLNPEALI